MLFSHVFQLPVLQQKTPLHLAAENGHHETVSVLLAAGADVNVQDRRQVICEILDLNPIGQ